MLIILTAVEKVAINFGKEDEKWLDEMSVEEAQKYVEEGQFAPGSMLPKVQAAMDFAASGEGRTAMITLLEKPKTVSRARLVPRSTSDLFLIRFGSIPINLLYLPQSIYINESRKASSVACFCGFLFI